ncbi:hypothetical protein [Dactylosporangium sp. NPDC048998]|uniref:hypothetical protein n=1 Tax=Dactylosporangium sp. NPDC048998 TaxID=3363976 RepID=UPI0037158A7A
MIRKLAGVLAAATALLAVSAGAASAAPAGNAALQQRVDSVLAAIPGGTQVSATEIRYDGLTVKFSTQSTATVSKETSSLALTCAYGHLCFTVNGNTNFDFVACKTWDLTNWLNTAPYINNQTTGTIARAYDNNWVQRWSSKAYDAGTANVNPWYHLTVC